MRSRKHTKNLRKKRLRTKKKYNKTQKGGYRINLESTNPDGEHNLEWYELKNDGIESFDKTLYYKNIFVRPSINEDGTIVTIIYNYDTYKREPVYKDIISGIYTFESPNNANIEEFFVKLISKWMAHYITPKPRRRRRRLGDSSRAVPRRRKRRLTTSRFSSIPKKSTTLLSSSQFPSPSSILRPPIPTPRTSTRSFISSPILRPPVPTPRLRQPVPKPRLRPPIPPSLSPPPRPPKSTKLITLSNRDERINGAIKLLVATLNRNYINLLIFDWDKTICKKHMFFEGIGTDGKRSVEDINLEDYFHLFDNGRSVFVELVLRLSDAGIRVAIASFGRCSVMGDTLDILFERHNLYRKKFIPNNLIFGGAYDPQHDLYCSIELGYGQATEKPIFNRQDQKTKSHKNTQIGAIIDTLKSQIGKINAFFIDDSIANIKNLKVDGVNYTHNINKNNGGFGIGEEQIMKMTESVNKQGLQTTGLKSRKKKGKRKKRSKRK
tara:strand:- start:248 stop:1729 length:1482 start_codon:yes stop_codon:yes gene_type:complete